MYRADLESNRPTRRRRSPMHGKGMAHELPPNAPTQVHLEHLRKWVQQGDAEAFAKALNLDPGRTRQWFDQGFTHEGYGAEVMKALGTLALMKIFATASHREGHAHG
jgi:hypothetical protein